MLTEEQLATMKAIHRRVYSIFEYKTDLKNYGEIERWIDTEALNEAFAAGKLVGDCDDFALACRQLLWEAGIENRLVLCKVEGGGHLVCEVEGWIFDNNFSSIQNKNDLQHEWISISGFKAGEPWQTIV